MNKYLILLTILIILFFLGTPAIAVTILEDSFNDMSKIDTAETTALVDTSAGEIRLPRAKIPNALVLREFQNEFIVINGNEVNFYVFDPATGSVKKNDLLSITDIDSPLGIAAAENTYSLWVLTKNEIRRYDLTENGMSYNPYLSITGLTDVFSISANPLDNTVVTLSSIDGKGVVTTYKLTEEGRMQQIPQLTFNTGLEDPLAVSVVPDTNDILVASGDKVYYYAFEASTNSYVQNLMMSITTGNITTSLSVQKNGDSYVVANQSGVDYYSYDVNTSQMVRIPVLSAGLSNYPYSVCLKPGSYEYAVLTEENMVQYWMYDSATGKMVRNPAMEAAGVAIFRKYYSPKQYVSMVVNTSLKYDEIRLTVHETTPENTEVNWYISFDNKATWQEITPGRWTGVSVIKPGTIKTNTFCLKAELVSPEGLNQDTPRISYVLLEVSNSGISEIECINITKPFEEYVGKFPFRYPDPDKFPVKMKKGSQIVFTVSTEAYTKSLTAEFSTGEVIALVPEKPVTEEKNKWTGAYVVQPDAIENTMIGLTLRTVRDTFPTGEMYIPDFVKVSGYVIYEMDLKLVR